MSVAAAFVHGSQATWLTDGTIPLDKDIVLLATSGGNPVCGRLAEHLMKKGTNIKGIVAMSGTPDPNQVVCLSFCLHCNPAEHFVFPSILLAGTCHVSRRHHDGD